MATKKKKKKADKAIPVGAYDSTSDLEISVMAVKGQNEDYSTKIIKEAKKVFNWKKIKILAKKSDSEELLEEGKNQVIELFRNADRLVFHTLTYNVLFLINAGKVLNLIEERLQEGEDRDKYVSWVSETIGKRYNRKANHAKQLARMGEFAEEHAALGKNRLIEFDRARKIAGKETLTALLDKHRFNDFADDMDEEGGSFRKHVDAIINFYRLKDVGIDATFTHAKNIAIHLKKALEVNKVRMMKNGMDFKDLTTPSEQRKELNKFIKNMKITGFCKLDKTPSMKSLGKILADLIEYVHEIGDNIVSVLQEADDDIRKDVIEAKRVVTKLAKTAKEVSATAH